jgi:hypothetical protein
MRWRHRDLWGLPILAGIALVVAHLVWATRIGAAPAANVIDKTFTKRVGAKPAVK